MCKKGFNELAAMKRGKETILKRTCNGIKLTAVEGESCGYGMIYDGNLDCVTCADVLNGCKLCTTKTNCVECEDNTKFALPIIDSYGDSFLECSAGMKVFGNCSVKEKIRIDCASANCTATPESDVCNSCVTQNFTQFYVSTFDDCAACDMYKYLLDGTHGCTDACLGLITSKDMGCTCTDQKCKVCFEGKCFQCQEGYHINKDGTCVIVPATTAVKRYTFFTRPFSEFEAETASGAKDPDSFLTRAANDFTFYTAFPQQI